ncbi:hypothetical protein PFISCL1PPCAC_13680, partial [Pristionchus fissidentatus]
VLKRITAASEYHRFICGVLVAIYVVITVSINAASATRITYVIRNKGLSSRSLVARRKGLILHGFAFSLVGVAYSGHQVLYGHTYFFSRNKIC